MSEDDDGVIRLPVRFKNPPSEDALSLVVVHSEGCNHKWHFVRGKLVHFPFLIREGETEVECGGCGTKLDPMWVLRNLANEENGWKMAQERYLDEMKRLSERSRTECQHCGKMTKISRTKAKTA